MLLIRVKLNSSKSVSSILQKSMGQGYYNLRQLRNIALRMPTAYRSWMSLGEGRGKGGGLRVWVGQKRRGGWRWGSRGGTTVEND